LFEAVVADIECAAVLCGERGQLSVILFLENAGEEVILELCDKILGECQLEGKSRRWRCSP